MFINDLILEIENTRLKMYADDSALYTANESVESTVDDRQMGHVNQVGHLSKTPLNLLKFHKIGSVDTFESKYQNYDQI